MVSNVKVYWKLSSSKMTVDQGWCIVDKRDEVLWQGEYMDLSIKLSFKEHEILR